SGLNHSSTTYLPLNCERVCVLPLVSGAEKSGAAPPTGGTSAMRSDDARSEKTATSIVFINYCDAIAVEMVSSFSRTILLVSNSGKTNGSADFPGYST